jgi:hypothetical protein
MWPGHGSGLETQPMTDRQTDLHGLGLGASAVLLPHAPPPPRCGASFKALDPPALYAIEGSGSRPSHLTAPFLNAWPGCADGG